MFDVFFSTIVPIPNQMILIRNWVFKLFPFGFFMKMAKYINIDKTSFKNIKTNAKKYFERHISFQIYPEGHRSENGKLRRFRNGAFILASHYNLPILPVCMVNTEKFISSSFPFFTV